MYVIQKIESLENKIKMLEDRVEELEAENDFGDKCKICYEDRIMYVLTCGHTFCLGCTMHFMDTKCPVCKCVPEGIQKLFF